MREFSYPDKMLTKIKENKITILPYIPKLPLKYGKMKKSKLFVGRVAYYPNTSATTIILLTRAGDVELNPEWQGSGQDKGTDYLQNFAKEISSGSSDLNIAQINIRSFRNKMDEIEVLM